MVPDRLSYSEMALPVFKYPSEWTEDYQSYLAHKQDVIDKIVEYMENYDDYVPALQKQTNKLKRKFFGGKSLYEEIKGE